MPRLLSRHKEAVPPPCPAVSERLLEAIRVGLVNRGERVPTSLSVSSINMAWMVVGLKRAGDWNAGYGAKEFADIIDPVARELLDAALEVGWCLGPANRAWRPSWIVAVDQPTFDELNAALEDPLDQNGLRTGRALGYPEPDVLAYSKSIGRVTKMRIAGPSPRIRAALAREPELGRYTTYVPYTASGMRILREAAGRIDAVFGVRPPLQPYVAALVLDAPRD